MASRYDLLRGVTPDGELVPKRQDSVEPAWKTEQKRQLLEAGLDPEDPALQLRMKANSSGRRILQGGDTMDLGDGVVLEGENMMVFDLRDQEENNE